VTPLAAGSEPVKLTLLDPTGAQEITHLFASRLPDLNGKVIAELAVDAIKMIADKRGNRVVADKENVQIVKKTGKSLFDTQLIKGMILDKEVGLCLAQVNNDIFPFETSDCSGNDLSLFCFEFVINDLPLGILHLLHNYLFCCLGCDAPEILHAKLYPDTVADLSLGVQLLGILQGYFFVRVCFTSNPFPLSLMRKDTTSSFLLIAIDTWLA
jgi:hypothetical protein